MANTNGGNINFNINMNVNKNGLNQILKPLQQIQNQFNSMSTDKLTTEFQQAANSAKQLESIINSSWNDKLGQLNLDKFNQSIKNSYGNMTQLKNSLAGASTTGQAAFSAVATSILNTNVQLRESNKLLDSMAESMANTVKWNITSSIFRSITGSIQKAYYYTKDLDTSLNNIRIVTKDSADEMDRFAKIANNTAKQLGRSTLDYTKAALSFYQQGLDAQQVQARTETTLKAQNITGVGTEMVDYLTAVWNGFGAQAEQVEEYVDKLAKVADSSASDMSQLAIAMSKVASTANVMGVNVDQLTAQLATVIATTRQAPESVGTAFKTIYSRLNDIKAGADEAEISLGNYSGKMADLGFNVLDANGRLRETGQVMEQIGSRWNTLTEEQQVYLAQTMGGMRQVNQIISLFENWTTYSQLLNTSLSAQGSLNEKNDIYLESTAAHMKQFQAQTERTYAILLDQDTIKGFSDVFTGVLKQFNDFIAGIGGGTNAFVHFGSIVANIFNKQIAQGIVGVQQSIQRLQANLGSLQAKQNIIQDIKNGIMAGYAGQGIFLGENALNKQAEASEKVLAVQKGLTAQQQKQAVQIQRQIGLTQQKIDDLQKQQQIANKTVEKLSQEEIIKGRSQEALKQELESLKISSQFHSQNLIAIENVERALNRQHTLGLSIHQTESQRLNLAKNLDKSYSEMEALWERQGKNVQEFNQRFTNVINGLRTGNTETRQFKTSWEAIKSNLSTLTKQQQIDLTTIDSYLKNIGIDTSKLTEAQRERLGILLQENTAVAQQGQHVIRLQSAIRAINGITQGLTAIIGGVSTAMNQTATAAEKANAAWSAISGGITGALMIKNPMWGFAATGILNLGKAILEVTGYWDKFQEHYKTAKQKADEFNKSISQVNKNNQEKNSQISSLEQIKQQYEKLSDVAGQYGIHINRLTDEEKDRYHELTNQFAKYNQSVIVGYDDQGNAIVRGQQALQGTIDLLKQAKKEANRAALGSVDKVLEGLSSRHVRKDYSDELEDAKKALDEAEEQYKTIEEDIKNHAELNINSLQLTNDEIQNQLSAYGDAVNHALISASGQTGQDFKNYKLLGTNKTFEEILDEYQTAIFEAFTTGKNGYLEIESEEKFKTALSLGQTLEENVNHYLAKIIGSENVNIDKFIALLHNYDESILQPYKQAVQEAKKVYEDVQQVAETQKEATKNYTEADANGLISILQNFDEYGLEYQNLQQTLKQLGTSSSFLDGLIVDYVTSISDKISPRQLLIDTENYVHKIDEVLKTSNDEILKTLQKENFENFEGTLEERFNEAIRIANQVISKLDSEKFIESEELRTALANILAQSLDLSGLKIDVDADGLTLDTSQTEGEVDQELKKLQTLLLDKINTFSENFPQVSQGLLFNSGFYNEDGSGLITDFLRKTFNEDELKNFEQTLDKIDWGHFLLYTLQTNNSVTALNTVIEESRLKLQDLAKVTYNLDFDTVFDTESLVKHLQAGKKLTDQEYEYLYALQSEDKKLRQLAQHENRSSNNYIKRLKQRESLGQEIYKKQLQAQKTKLEQEIASNELLLQTGIDGQDRIDIQNELIQQKKDLLQINYDLNRSESVLAERAKEQAQAAKEQAEAQAETAKKRIAEQEDANLARLKSQSQVIPNATTALDKLKKGQVLSSDQAAAIAYLERSSEQLNQIAVNNDMYSKEYTDELERQLQLQKDLTKQTQQQAIAALQAKKARLERDSAKLDSQLTAYDNYNKAKEIVANSQPQMLKSNATSDRPEDTIRQSKLLSIAQTLVKKYQDQYDLTQDQYDLEKQKADIDNDILETQEELVKWRRLQNQEEEQAIKTMSQKVAIFRDSVNTLLDGKTLSDDDFTAFSTVLDDIVSKYPGLITQADILKNTWLAGTDAYEEALNQVKVALDAILYEDLAAATNQGIDKLSEALNDIEVGIDSSEFDSWADKVQEFLDAEKEIVINVHSDAENEFNHIREQMNEVYQAASKIGENFVASANDLRELNAVFPGILQGMQRLDDGSYQLNSNIVQRAIATAQTEVAADTESVNSRIEHQANLLHAKAANYRQMAEACFVLAGQEVDSEMDASQARQTLSTGLAKAKGLNSQLAAQQQMDNQQKVADSANENAGIMAKNWAQGADASGRAIHHFASFAVNSMHQVGIATAAAARGQQGGAVIGFEGITSSYTGEAGKNAEASILDGLAEALEAPTTSADYYKDTGEKILSLADMTQKQANDMDGMKAQIDAELENLNQGLNNVSSGYGIKGPTADKSSGSGKGGSGKGSSGKEQKEKTPDKKDPLEQTIDRYHDINLEIKRIQNNLDIVQKQQKKLVGKDLIDNLNKQLAILQKQIQAYETKIKLAQDQSDELRATLQGQGVTFDPLTGAIDNYSAIITQKLNQVNDVIAHYNNLTKDQQEAYKDVVQQAKKNYQKFKKNLENYDKLTSETIPELRKNIQQIRDKEIEMQISKFKMKIQIELDLSQAIKDWNKFKKTVVDQIRDDNIVENAKATAEDIFAYYNKDNRSQGLVLSLTDQVFDTLNQINQINSGGSSTVYGDNKSQAIEDLKKYADDLMSSLQNVEEIIKQVNESFFDMVDAAEEAFSGQQKQYEFLGKLIEHDKKLIELLYGDKSYDKLSEYYKQQKDADNKQLDFQKRQKQFWQDQMQASRIRMSSLDKQSNEYKEQQKRFKSLEDQWLSSVEKFNSKVEESIQNLLDNYQNNVSIIFDDLGKKLTQGQGIEYIADEWDLINQEADMYLDKVNSMAQIQNFEDAAEAAIESNKDNLKAQQSLTNFMNEQLKFLKDKDRLTQYDVDRANMLLQIEIKRLALENSRQNKSKLRLRRDSQGNYTYQYTADEDDLRQAEKALRDAQVDLYNFDKNKLKSNLDDVKSLTSSMMQELQQLYKQYPTWTDEAQQKRKLIVQKYGSMINGVVGENQQIRLNLTNSAIYSLSQLYNTDVKNFQNMADTEKQILMSTIIPYWTNGVQTIVDTIGGQGGIGKTLQKTLDDLSKNTGQYQEDLSDIQKTAGISFEAVGDGTDLNIEKTQRLLDSNDQLIDSYNRQFDAILDVIGQVDDLTDSYRTARSEAIAATEAAYNYWQQEKRNQIIGVDSGSGSNGSNLTGTDSSALNSYKEAAQSNNISTYTAEDTSSTGKGNKTSKELNPNTDTIEGIAAAIWMDGSQSGWGDNPSRRKKFIEKFNAATADKIQAYINTHAQNGDIFEKWQEKRAKLKNYYYSKFDTGGYTGNWGKTGKIGILHEKEIVLNQQDTANILSAVNIVRSIDELLNTITANTDLPTMLSRVVNNTSTQNMNQNVQISASFPAVNSRFEIEQAFNNLVNRASQYAFNTQR